MAAPKRILAIDFGNSAIKVGCFQADSVNGLSLLGYQIKELGVDPTQDEDRLAAIQPALTEAIDALGGRNLPALCSLSGQYAFLRFVKLPPVSADQLDQMIGFEAQQNVPFPIKEVVWDYQLIRPGNEGGDISALLVAVKDDLVEANLASVRDLSMDVVNVDVAPVTLINAYLYNYPRTDGCSLLVDIGARSTNLIFFEQDQVFARVVPIGGHMITQSISNEFQEPYKASEVMKKGKGFVGLGGAYQDPDDIMASRISKLARSTYSRLHAEINRSISFYRNQQGGSPPHRLLLAGGASSMAYSDLFFRDKFNIEVEYFNPLQRVAVSPQVNREALSRDAFALGEMVGLALRRAGECPVEINLRPQSLREATRKKSQMPVLTFALIIWLLAFLIAAGANYYRLTGVQGQVAQRKSDLQQQEQRSKKIKQLNEQVISLKRTASELTRLARQRTQYHDLLTRIDQATTPLVGLWLTETELEFEGGKIDVVPVSATPSPPNPKPKPKQGNKATPMVMEEPEPVNLAPHATDVSLRGYYESAMGSEIVNRYVLNLQNTGLFSEVKIVRRDTSDDQIAQAFHLRATFNEANRINLLP